MDLEISGRCGGRGSQGGSHGNQSALCGFLERTGRSRAGRLFVASASELLGHRSDVNSRSTPKTDFDRLVQLLHGDEGTLRSADFQTLVDKVFRINGPCAREVEVRRFDPRVPESTVAIERDTA